MRIVAFITCFASVAVASLSNIRHNANEAVSSTSGSPHRRRSAVNDAEWRKLVHNVLHRIDHSKDVETLDREMGKARSLIEQFAANNAGVDNIEQRLDDFLVLRVGPTYHMRMTQIAESARQAKIIKRKTYS